jgi:transcription-repair coupling factor (superfamily II helicase)
MLEEKIEALKEEKNTGNADLRSLRKTAIDLMISATIPQEYFLSETDKLNFYREVEYIQTREDIDEMRRNTF